MKIKINNLFGKYNNELDLDNKYNIYIGENGIGKSTSIKIYNALFKYDYINLKQYYFESIELINENKSIIINYNDLVLSNNYLMKKYCGNDYDNYIEIKKEYENLKKEYPNVELNELHSEDKKEDELINMFQFNYEFEQFISELDNRLLYKVLKFNNKILNNEKYIIFHQSRNGCVTSYLDFIKKEYESAKINARDGLYYEDSNIREKHLSIKEILCTLKYKDTLFIDMSSDFDITNDISRTYVYNDAEKNAMDNMSKEIKEQNKNKKSLLNYKVDLKDKSDAYRMYSDINFIKHLKSKFKVDRGKGIENNKIDFGYFLFNNIYTNEKIEEFKNDFYDFLMNNISSLKKFKNPYKINNQSFNKIKSYLAPLIAVDDILYEKINKDWKLESNFEEDFDYQLLVKFCLEYKNKYINIDDERLIKLNNLFKKYFKNKEVIATPFGISISTKEFSNDICFEELSSGERKIIILFTIAVFSKDLIILLDEPETSLSVVWQEQLINDIIENTEFNRLIVATQSPYIIESELLDEYIIPLIDGE